MKCTHAKKHNIQNEEIKKDDIQATAVISTTENKLAYK